MKDSDPSLKSLGQDAHLSFEVILLSPMPCSSGMHLVYIYELLLLGLESTLEHLPFIPVHFGHILMNNKVFISHKRTRKIPC